MQNFHTLYQSILKKKLNASYVGWETTNGNLSLKIIVEGTPKYIALEGEFGGVTQETYIKLIEDVT